MNRFLICHLASDKSLYSTQPLHLGKVEMRGSKQDSPSEDAALRASLASNTEAVELAICPRLVTVVEAATARRADILAVRRFEEALDALEVGSCCVLSELCLLKSGFARNLGNGIVSPILARRGLLSPSPMFRLSQGQFAQMEFAEALFAVAPSDLGDRLFRSAHWSRKAQWENNVQLRVLFRWFAIEAAWKRKTSRKRKTSDDDVVPIAMLALGFPTGHHSTQLRRATMDALYEHPRYRSWREAIRRRLQELRDWRNDSVHSGFRPWDVTSARLTDFDEISTFACSRSQGLLTRALHRGLATIDEARAQVTALFEGNSNAVSDVHNTIIYSLENRLPQWKQSMEVASGAEPTPGTTAESAPSRR
jgi:hypothetical protein